MITSVSLCIYTLLCTISNIHNETSCSYIYIYIYIYIYALCCSAPRKKCKLSESDNNLDDSVDDKCNSSECK